MSLTQATWNSINVVYAQLALDVGVRNFADTAYEMGITSPLGINADGQPCRRGAELLHPARGRHRRARRGRDAARDGRRLRHARRRRRPPPRDVDRQGRVPRRQGRQAGRRDGHARAHPGPGLRGHAHPRGRDHQAAPAPATPRSAAARRPARPAPPTTSPTPGSSDTRRATRPPSGPGTRSRAAFTGYGGPTSGPIWRAYMQAAQGQQLPRLRNPRADAGARAAARRSHPLQQAPVIGTGAKYR